MGRRNNTKGVVMKKYTIVANISYEVNNVKHIEMNVHWDEGKNMYDALHNH